MEKCTAAQGPRLEDNNCISLVLTFCNVTGQAVSNNSINRLLYNSYEDFDKLMSDGVELPKITVNETISKATIWNRIYKVLKNIYNYGALGTRNPLVYSIGDFVDTSKVYRNRTDGHWVRPAENSVNQNWLFLLNNGSYATGWFVIKDSNYPNGYQIYYADYNSSEDAINTSHGHIYSKERWINGKCYSFNDDNGYLELSVYRQGSPNWDRTKTSYYDNGSVWISDYTGGIWNREQGHNRTPIYEKDSLNDVVALEDKILAELYNDILSKLSLATSSNKVTASTTKFTKTQIDKLLKIIDEYNLNDTRCNVCNSNCNALCLIEGLSSGGGVGCSTLDYCIIIAESGGGHTGSASDDICISYAYHGGSAVCNVYG